MKYKHLKDFKEWSDVELKKLQKSTVTVVGLGSVGSVTAEILVRMGINIRIIDKGRVKDQYIDSMSLYSEKDLNRFKVNQAKKILVDMNKGAKVKAFNEEVNENTLFMADSDLVIDCANDIEFSKLLSEYCRKKKMNYVLCMTKGAKAIVHAMHGRGSMENDIDWKFIDENGLFAPVTRFAAAFAVLKACKLLVKKKLARVTTYLDLWNNKIEF